MTTKQKLVSIYAGNETFINDTYLEKGWVVKQMVAENVSSCGANVFASNYNGKIVYLLEKTE